MLDRPFGTTVAPAGTLMVQSPPHVSTTRALAVTDCTTPRRRTELSVPTFTTIGRGYDIMLADVLVSMLVELVMLSANTVPTTANVITRNADSITEIFLMLFSFSLVRVRE
jgi:hypothetical protein